MKELFKYSSLACQREVLEECFKKPSSLKQEMTFEEACGDTVDGYAKWTKKAEAQPELDGGPYGLFGMPRRTDRSRRV
jgi:hypothetical protein